MRGGKGKRLKDSWLISWDLRHSLSLSFSEMDRGSMGGAGVYLYGFLLSI